MRRGNYRRRVRVRKRLYIVPANYLPPRLVIGLVNVVPLSLSLRTYVYVRAGANESRYASRRRRRRPRRRRMCCAVYIGAQEGEYDFARFVHSFLFEKGREGEVYEGEFMVIRDTCFCDNVLIS